MPRKPHSAPVPLSGNVLAVTFVTALNWRLEQRREKRFTELAEVVEELRQQVDDLDLSPWRMTTVSLMP